MTMPNPQLDLTNPGAGQEPAVDPWDRRFTQPIAINRGQNGAPDVFVYLNPNGTYRHETMYPGGTGTWTGAPPGPAAPPPKGVNDIPTQAGRDAFAVLKRLLDEYGLGSLSQWVIDKLVEGATDAQLRLELLERPEFQARFPVIGERRKAGLTPVSASEVLAYEKEASRIMRAAGLPSIFQAEGYAQKLMAKDVSIAEITERVQEGYLRVAETAPEVRAVWGTWFGTGNPADSQLAAFFLDPDLAAPELEKIAMTSFVGGIGFRFGNTLARDKAREIADTGVTEAAVWQGFRELDVLKPLFEETFTEDVDLKTEVEGVGAVFGTTPGALDLIERRRLTRVASFQGGGGVAQSEGGGYGLGSADR